MNEYQQGFLDAVVLIKHFYEKYRDNRERFEEILEEIHENILNMKINKIKEQLVLLRS